MKKAYVLLNTEIGSEKEVLNALEKIPEVKEAHRLYGVYDIIVRVESDTMLNLKDALIRIGQIKLVRSTMVMIVTH